MRFRAIVLCGLLTFGLMWTNSAFSQTTEDRIAAMEDKMALMEAIIQRILAGRRAVDRLLADAIVLTDQDCAVLGPDWKRYEGMGGRFPLGAGMTKDARGEERTFTVGGRGGSYLHQLTVAEMPSHTHPYTLTNWHIAADIDDERRVPHHDGAQTGATGGNQPHNNTPPYLVTNFCHKAGDGD